MARPGNWLALVLAAVCIGLGYGYWRDRLELGALRAVQDSRAVVEKQDKKEIADLRKKVDTMQAAETARVKRNEEVRKARATLGAARSQSAPNVIRYSDIVRDHPEFAALRQKDTLRNVVRQYGDAIATLNLPADKAAQLKNLLVERQLSQQDAREAAEAAGLKPGSPEFAQATAQAYQEVQQQITDLVGKDGMAALQQASMISGMKTMVTYTYAPDFADAGIPLTSEQETSLAVALNPANAMRNNPNARDPSYRQPDPDTWLSPADQQTIAKAAQTLSPAQLEIFKTDLAEQNHRNAIMQPYFQAARNNSGSGVTIIQ